MEQKKLENIVETKYLSQENAAFKDGEGFIMLDDKRVFLHRMFPFEEEEKYICVLDDKQQEIGIIKDMADFDSNTKEILRKELYRKYFMKTIVSIDKLKDKYGYTYWDITTTDGRLSFTLRDTSRNIVKIGDDRLMIVDIDGNRYEIPSIAKMDRASYRKIELYL